MNDNMNFSVEKGKFFKLSEVMLLILITTIIGFILGLSVFKIMENDIQQENETPDELLRFIDNYNYITSNYYGELDKDELISSAISGMLESIDDPYTTYIDDTDSNVFNTTLEGSFQGIGVEVVNDSNNNIVVYNVLDDSPAFKAGIQSLDIIKSINGQSLDGVSTSDFVTMIKNDNSAVFKLVLLRGSEELEVIVNRELVVIKSVESEIFDVGEKKIGYIYISIFANNTYSQFKSQLEDLERQNIHSLIIDVRGNTGGHLSSVENILGLFLDSSHIIYQTEDKNGVEMFYSHGNVTKSYDIAVLTNEASASASEILAACLKEEYGATVVGKCTYGKGTVQELKTLPDGEQYKFTTKKWLTPNGDWINEVGVCPDIEVEFNKTYYDNPVHENDEQLQSALNFLRSK